MSKLEIENQIQNMPKCEALGCNENLGYFDIKNKSRFCKKCRINYYVLRWRCKGKDCNNILCSSECRETRKYCNRCQGKTIEI